MANNSALKQDIRDYIYTNHNEEITGNILRDVLLEMVDTLGDGWTYKGVATTTTNPGTPDDNVFYIATAPGSYTNFGGLSVSDGEVAILKYNGSWAKDVTGAATKAQVTQLGQDVDDLDEAVNGLWPNLNKQFLNFAQLTSATQNILKSLVSFDFKVPEFMANDVIKIITYGYTSSKVLFQVKDITRNKMLPDMDIPIADLSGDGMKSFSFKNNYIELSVTINASLASSTMGIITSDPIEVAPSGTFDDCQFSNLEMTNANEYYRGLAIKSFVVISNTPVESTDEFVLRAFGWTTSGSLYGWLQIYRNGSPFIEGTFDTSTTYPSGVKTYAMKNFRGEIRFSVDWTAMTTNKWYNSATSTLALRNIEYVLANEDLMSTPYQNLFDYRSVMPNQYLASTGGGTTSVATFYTTDYIQVEPGKIYRCSLDITRICYYGSRTQSSVKRTLTSVGKTITPQSGENFVRFSRTITGAFESTIVAEVESETDGTKNVSLAFPEKYILKDSYENRMIDGYEEGTFAFGDALQTASYAQLTDGKLLYVPLVGNYTGKITKLSFHCICDSSFVLTIGTGIVDQRKWGLVYATTTINVSNGLNEVDVDINIGAGERLFFVGTAESATANAKLCVASVGYHQESTNDITMDWAAGEILARYTIVGRLNVDTTLATKTSVESLGQVVSNIGDAVNNLSINGLFVTSPNETYYRIKVANDGTLSTEAVPVQGKILIMGNSYDVHDYVAGLWWGDFGMAASRKENDWKHTLLRKLRNEDNLIYNFRKQTLANWETKGWGDKPAFDYSTLDAALNDTYSMVIIRVGENSLDTDLASIQNRTETLLDYIISKLGSSVPILWGGCVKIRTLQNPAFQAACQGYANVTYVDMEPAGQLPTFQAGLDWRVFGDDGVWHTVSESSMASSVAGHPNDSVFAKMAELFYPVVLDKLT